MSSFFRVGLPWAISLGIVFYLGLELGSKSGDYPSLSENTYSPPNLANQEFPKENVSRTSPSDNNKKAVIHNDRDKEKKSVIYSPPLPPNLRRIMEDGSVLERMGAYMDALRNMDSNSLGEVVDAFEALPKGFGRHLEMKLLMRSWSAIDPAGALLYAKNSMSEKNERGFAMSEVIAGWTALDSDASIAWVKKFQSQNPESKELEDLMIGVVKGLAENDLETADNFFRTFPEGNAKWRASNFLVEEYTKLDTKDAIQWAEKFPKSDEPARSIIFGQVADILAQKDLKGTATWVEDLPPGKASDQVLHNLLSKWTVDNPMEAAEWASQLKDIEKRGKAMKLLANMWSLRDPVATASWLNNFPPSLELDPVVGEFVNRISIKDPEGAVGWASSIVNKEQREKALGKALRAWGRKNPEGLRAWQEKNGLPAKEKKTE